MKIGIIAGSGLYDMLDMKQEAEFDIDTAYGKPSDKYLQFSCADKKLYFLRRHGKDHKVAPQNINYRANIEGFNKLGVGTIIAFSAAGGINSSYSPGDIVLCNNAIDMTSGRNETFYDGEEIYHVDMSFPFCHRVIDIMKKAAQQLEIEIKEGVYICTNGPRLETASEIKMFEKMGADLVGMTLFPEITLAREKNLCYINISTISNFAAGISKEKLTSDDITEVAARSSVKLKSLLKAFLEMDGSRSCRCSSSLDNTKISK